MANINIEPKNIYIWNNQVKKVCVWNNQVRPSVEECVIYKIKAINGWQIYIWTHWANYSWSRNAPYSRYISVDGWPETLYTWTWWTRITLTWYTNYQIYTVKIRPSVVDYWWARACWWWNSWAQDTVLMEIVYDGSYIWYAASATDTWNYFRAYQYIKCTQITQAPEEYLPDTVTTIWTYFRNSQYYQSTQLPASPMECLPNSVTSIWAEFRWSQYAYCSNIKAINWWKDLNIWNSGYRYSQYSSAWWPLKMRVIWNVWYTGYYNYWFSDVPSVWVQSDYLSNFKSNSSTPRSSITDDNFHGYTTRPWES